MTDNSVLLTAITVAVTVIIFMVLMCRRAIKNVVYVPREEG